MSLPVLIEIATQSGATAIVEDARELAGRVAAGRFFVACVGQFKRGKSTLINALVGDPILPMGVVPVTAVVTILRYGSERAARVRSAGSDWQAVPIDTLTEYVSEERNPGNRKGITAVEVLAPGPLLANGLCLVDTPGIGSVFEANTEATRSFIPHIDAAVVVLGADPPISGEELSLVEEVARQVDHLIFVLNKADRLSAVDLNEARVFTRRVISERLGREVGIILEVSAGERLFTGTATREWETLEETLRTLAETAGSTLVRAAAERGTIQLTNRLLRELEEQRGALTRPIQDSERRVEALRRCVADAERALNELGYLFSAEQDRLSRGFGERRESFIARTLTGLTRELEETIAVDAAGGIKLRGRAMALARDLSRREISTWMNEIEPVAEELYRQATSRFVQLANDFLERLAASGAGLADLSGTIGTEEGFRTEGRFYHHSLGWTAPESVSRSLIDLVRSRSSLVHAVQRDARGYLEQILKANAMHVESDLDERVLESRRRLESDIRARLRDVTTTAERALERAREHSLAGAEAVKAELARLESLIQRARALRRATVQGATSCGPLLPFTLERS